MLCRKCKREIPPDSLFCPYCGVKQDIPERKPKGRGNSTGSVYRLPNGKWRAAVTLGYEVVPGDKKRRIYKTKSGFKTKKEALDYLPTLKGEPKKQLKITFKALYDKWLPTHRAGTSTIDCYKSAMKYFAPVYYLATKDIVIDDLQECIDECPRGKRTRQNMKTACGLIYKFGIPRGYIPDNMNLSEYLIVGGGETKHKRGFSEDEIELIRKACGRIDYADYIYCMIYTGFRLSEFLSLDVRDYDREKKYLVGGSKTEAGTNRVVTISPKIQPIIDELTKNKISGALFCNKETNNAFTADNFRKDYFYSALEAAGINEPQKRNLTPHSCRHTFATLMKNVKAADKDKLELIGHSSEEMLRYYQDVNIDDLRKITEQI